MEKGLVYESKKPVFWSTGAQTALAEAEVEYQDREDPAVYVKFPIVTGALAGQASIVIWTTTPWTLPANLAIAVHPKERLRRRRNSRTRRATPKTSRSRAELRLRATAFLQPRPGLAVDWQNRCKPFPAASSKASGRSIRFCRAPRIVLTADFVTMDTGTGAVHIAPGHGEDDYSLGKTNGLPILSPVDDHGRFTEEVGLPELVGKYVFDANADIVALLRERGHAARASRLTSIPIRYCWRSKTPIIFRAVEQFFIRIDDLRAKALDAIDQGDLDSALGRKPHLRARSNRDPTGASRASAAGVCRCRFFIPPKARRLLERRSGSASSPISSRSAARMSGSSWMTPRSRTKLGLPEGTRHRNDTIDVWIDSGVSHAAVCATHPELRDPADMYLEATDQHRGWFQSSLMTSVALHDRAPYKTCVTHGFVVDVDGKKISKSSTYNKPMDAGHFVGRHGADIVRLWVSSVNYTDDVPFSEEMFTRLGDTYRRIRNTLRILLGNLHDFRVGRARRSA